MPTIYRWTEPVSVTQQRYNELLAQTAAGLREPQWFATSTPRPVDATNQIGGVSKTDRRLAGKFPYRRPKVLTHVTSMQSGHGWTASNALANGMNDNTDVALGAQSAFITSKTDSTAATLTSPTLTLDMSATKTLRVLLKVTGSDNIQGLGVYVTSDAFVANYSFSNVQNVVADPTVRWLKDNEWKWVTITMASSNVQTGSAPTGVPNYSAINGIRFRLLSSAGTSATLRVQAVQVIERASWSAGGVVCFTYDDSYRNQYAIAKQHLDKYGYPGTAYTIHSNVTDGDNGNTSWLTTQMLKDMRSYSRWEIGLHTETLANHARAFASGTNSATGTTYGTNPLTSYELDTDITRELEWLEANELTDGFLGHCHPQGRFSTSVNQLLARRTAYARAMTANSNGLETVPPADPYAIRCITLDNNSNIANLQAIVDQVALQGGMVVFCCHDIVTTPSTSTQFKTADHQTLVDYVASKPGIRVMTMGDVMRACASQEYSGNPTALQAGSLQVGEETMPRELMTTGTGPSASGQLRLTYFTAQKTEVTTQVRIYTSGTAAGATPTLCRIGLYVVNPDNSITLVASTANDTTLFAATNTAYTKSWSTPYTKVAGQRYAIGVLVVTAATLPNFAGQGVQQSLESTTAPYLATSVNSLSDLPASASSFSASAARPYFAILP